MRDFQMRLLVARVAFALLPMETGSLPSDTHSRVGLAAIVYYVMHTWLKRMDSQVWRQPKRAGKQSKTWSQAHSLPCSLVEGSEPMKQAKRRRQKLEMTINQITWSTLDTHVSGQ